MARRVRVFVEVDDYLSLDRLISTLTAIRDSLPADAEPELTLRGDDNFGRHLSIAYFRELTEEEAAMERRYAGGRASSNNRSRPKRARSAAKVAIAGINFEAVQFAKAGSRPPAACSHSQRRDGQSKGERS